MSCLAYAFCNSPPDSLETKEGRRNEGKEGEGILGKKGRKDRDGGRKEKKVIRHEWREEREDE
jgi:hypothetical protein